MPGVPVIEVENLVKSFGHFIANDHLTFSVDKGEIFGFLGANGAGKTTAIRIMCGLLSPTSGKVKVAGFNTYNQSEKIKQNIGYMSQKFSLYNDLTVKENFRFYGGIYGLSSDVIASRTDELLGRLGLINEKNRLLNDTPLGWKQKLAFAVAIMHRPQLVFLDEPTGGVDPIARRQFWEIIYETAAEGITVFITTHYMDEAEYCQRVCIMTEGKIVALDTPERLKKMYDAKSIEEVFLKTARNIHE